MTLLSILEPFRFRILRRYAAETDRLRILDIGCGNSSPTVAKRWQPDCEYHGVDIQEYNQTEADLKAMDRFFLVTADGGGYDKIPDSWYDVVILNHVIEHVREPLQL